MDIERELEAHAERAAQGGEERLTADVTKARLRLRVARGRRAANAGIAAGVAAVAVVAVAAGAWAAPRVFAQPAAPTPRVSPSGIFTPPNDGLPALGDDDYLAPMLGAYRWSAPVDCLAVPTVDMSTQGAPFPGYVSGLPVWLDGNAMYDGSDIPLYSEDTSTFAMPVTSVRDLYMDGHLNVLTLIAPNGAWWAFDAEYRLIDEADNSGIYLVLSASPQCGGGPRDSAGPLPAGVYQARMLSNAADVGGLSTVRELGPVTVLWPDGADSPATAPPWSPEPYVATPFDELPRPGEEGYLAPVVAESRPSGRLDCQDTRAAEMPAPNARRDYPSPIRSWLGLPQLYDSARVLIYSAEEPDYAAVSRDYLSTFPEDQTHFLSLVNSAGGDWVFRVSVYENDGSTAGEPGIYAWLTFAAGCGGGNRTYGGPMPAGFFEARILSSSDTSGEHSRILFLGDVEVR